MNSVTIAQVVSVVVGAIVALRLVSVHPVHIAVLGVCAAVYMLAPKFLK